jgi:hypothetical protein
MLDIRTTLVETMAHLAATAKAGETLGGGNVQLGTEVSTELLDILRTNGHASLQGIGDILSTGAIGMDAPRLARVGADLTGALQRFEGGIGLDTAGFRQFAQIGDEGFAALVAR